MSDTLIRRFTLSNTDESKVLIGKELFFIYYGTGTGSLESLTRRIVICSKIEIKIKNKIDNFTLEELLPFLPEDKTVVVCAKSPTNQMGVHQETDTTGTVTWVSNDLHGPNFEISQNVLNMADSNTNTPNEVRFIVLVNLSSVINTPDVKEQLSCPLLWEEEMVRNMFVIQTICEKKFAILISTGGGIRTTDEGFGQPGSVKGSKLVVEKLASLFKGSIAGRRKTFVLCFGNGNLTSDSYSVLPMRKKKVNGKIDVRIVEYASFGDNDTKTFKIRKCNLRN